MIPNQPYLKCDVCIIGAGIVGLYLAEASARAGQKVIILERGNRWNIFGSFALNRESNQSDQRNIQNFGKTLEVNHFEGDRHFLGALRLAAIGGTATVWGAENLLITSREFIEAFSWNKSLSYEDYNNSVVKIFRFLKVRSPSGGTFSSNDIDLNRFFYASNFDVRKRYRKLLEKYKGNVRLLSGIYMRSIDNQRAVLSTAGGRELRVEFSKAVLALGGIETARFLKSQEQFGFDGQVGGYEEVLHGDVGELECTNVNLIDEFIAQDRCIRGETDFHNKTYSFVIRFRKRRASDRLLILIRNLYRSILFKIPLNDVNWWSAIVGSIPTVNVWLCIQGTGFKVSNDIRLMEDHDRFGGKRVAINWAAGISVAALTKKILREVNLQLSARGLGSIRESSIEGHPTLGMLHGGAHMSGGLGNRDFKRRKFKDNFSLREYPNVYACSSALFDRAPAANLTSTTLYVADLISREIVSNFNTVEVR